MHIHTPLSAPARVLLFLLAIAVLCVLVVATAAGWGIKYYNSPGPNSGEVTVIIPKGTGFQGITALLEENGVIRHPTAFSAIAVLFDKAGKVKAGEYAFPARVPPKDVLTSLVEGKTVIHRLTIPEGYTTVQILAMVAAEDKLQGDVPTDVREGELLPETYYFSRNDSRGELVARMRREMRTLLMQLWENRRANLPYRTPQEALTLASIVEKETSLSSEYGTVASVYVNRLRKGMRLQADPTTIYAVTQGKYVLDRPLRYSDLRMESPYNTYTSDGLPPGPIANPGARALAAALNPPETDYIFFVADGRGGHNFSVTYKDHSRYVDEFRAKLRARDVQPAQAAPAPVNSAKDEESATKDAEAESASLTDPVE